MTALSATFAVVIFASVILAVVTAFVASFAVVIPSDAPVESAIFAVTTAFAAIASESTALSASSDAPTDFSAKSDAFISSENVVGGLRNAF